MHVRKTILKEKCLGVVRRSMKCSSTNQQMIAKIVSMIPQYPIEITKVSLCKQVGIDYNRLNCYLASASDLAMIGETESTLTRCEDYYGAVGKC